MIQPSISKAKYGMTNKEQNSMQTQTSYSQLQQNKIYQLHLSQLQLQLRDTKKCMKISWNVTGSACKVGQACRQTNH